MSSVDQNTVEREMIRYYQGTKFVEAIHTPMNETEPQDEEDTDLMKLTDIHDAKAIYDPDHLGLDFGLNYIWNRSDDIVRKITECPK